MSANVHEIKLPKPLSPEDRYALVRQTADELEWEIEERKAGEGVPKLKLSKGIFRRREIYFEPGETPDIIKLVCQNVGYDHIGNFKAHIGLNYSDYTKT